MIAQASAASADITALIGRATHTLPKVNSIDLRPDCHSHLARPLNTHG